MKKLLSVLLTVTFILLAFAGCANEIYAPYEPIGNSSDTSDTSSEELPKLSVNPLTGIRDLEPEKESLRPVAVMINNLSPAQNVQTGLAKAEIIYETYVEAGITRLLAVFKDISSVGQLGTVRSARYSYVDLANGHDALYIHAGIDATYCKPYAAKVAADHINLIAGAPNSSWFREKNGLATEHTLYTTGEKLTETIASMKRRATVDDAHKGNWVNFAAESDSVLLGTHVELPDGVNSVTVPFSGSYKTHFIYDAETKMYVRYKGDELLKDYKTGESISRKNIFILFTTVTPFEDNYHVKEYLDGGDGYYISEGGYTAIKWTKGKTGDGFKFTDESGKELKVNAGTSWVCIAKNDVKSKILFE